MAFRKGNGSFTHSIFVFVFQHNTNTKYLFVRDRQILGCVGGIVMFFIRTRILFFWRETKFSLFFFGHGKSVFFSNFTKNYSFKTVAFFRTIYYCFL